MAWATIRPAPLPEPVLPARSRILDEHMQAVLIDLDSVSIGPREWDLIQTALFADRLGWHTTEEYRTLRLRQAVEPGVVRHPRRQLVDSPAAENSARRTSLVPPARSRRGSSVR